MLALLPLLVFGAIAAAWRRRAAEPWPEALLAAAAVCGIVACVGAELLGAIGLFTRGGVLALWLAAAVAAGLLGARKSNPGPETTPSKPSPRRHAEEAIVLAGIAAIVLLVGLTAWMAAPNTWDALTYHLPRVRHWIQDRSLANYPTANLRQLTLAPGAEILLGHLRLLAGSDRSFNLVQWGAWIGCIVAASSIAARLGGGGRARLAAASFAATLPMAILQGSSSQNDLVVSFWLLAFACFALRSLAADGGFAALWPAAGCLALAILTKATALLFGFPLVLWWTGGLLRRRGLDAAGPLAAAAGIVLFVNAGVWARNLSLFGSPLGTDYGTVNESVTPAILVSNASRNTALHLAGPGAGWNRSVEEAIAALHGVLGVGVNDPRSTWRGAGFQVPASLAAAGRPGGDEAIFAMFHDAQAGNPVHLLLLAAAGALVLARRTLRIAAPLGAYLAATAAGALLFCLVLRWQPWNARLQLPLFLLGAPLAGVALSGWRRPGWTERGCLLLLVLALPWVLVNATRPLVGASSVLRVPRFEQYFAEVPDSGPVFLAAARAASSPECRRIGLEIRADDPEELVWVSLERAAPGSRRVEQVGVRNRSAELSGRSPFAEFQPCAVVALEGADSVGRVAVFSGPWAGGRIAVERR